MTKATLATRTAAGLSAALISALSLVACGGNDDSGADEPAEETAELTDDSADTADDTAEQSAKRRDREGSATRDERRRDRSDQDEKPASSSSESEADEAEEPETLSAAAFCDIYTRYETKGVFAEADTPDGARRAAERLDGLALRTPDAIQDDIALMARLFDEIADANGDEDEMAEIDASELPATQKHLERWQKKHC